MSRTKEATRKRRQRQDLLRKQKAELEALESEQEEAVDEAVLDKLELAEDGDAETVTKGMEYASPAIAIAGPTTFEELDAVRAAEKKASEMREVAWDVESLVSNIVHSPMMEPSKKAAAIEKIGKDFATRVGQAARSEVTEKDMDVLVLESILGRDRRNMGVLDHFTDFISKARMTPAAEEKLSDEQFALVDASAEKKARRYPIHDKAHVRSSMTQAAQVIKAGGAGADEARAALPNIRAAAKKFGIEASLEKSSNAILVEKDSQGDWRWVGWASNNFKDWSGDIITEAAHLECVEWLDKNSDVAPLFATWHTPGTVRQSPADFWDYQNGFLILSGKLTEKEAASLLEVQAEVDLGMSIGALAYRDAQNPKNILKYRLYEVSDLPLKNADNPFTDFALITKEADMDKKEYLAKMIGADRAELFMQKTAEKQEALREAGVAEKAQAEPPKAEAPAAEPALAVQVNVADLLEQIKKELDIDGLSATIAQLQDEAEKVPVLEALVKDLSASKDDALAEMIAPPAVKFAWSQKARASQSSDNLVKEGDPLEKAGPKVPDGAWLSQATGTVPVSQS